MEDEFAAIVVNAAHIKAVPGRKTDVKDAEWIAELLQHGLLRASFIPDRAQRELRELTRYRRSLVQERSREANRIQKLWKGPTSSCPRWPPTCWGSRGEPCLPPWLPGRKTRRRWRTWPGDSLERSGKNCRRRCVAWCSSTSASCWPANCATSSTWRQRLSGWMRRWPGGWPLLRIWWRRWTPSLG